MAALKKEMSKLGYLLEDIDGRELKWDGTTTQAMGTQAAIDTYDDHRMALAFAPLAMKNAICINNPQVVSKSYPRFWDDLRAANFSIQQL